MNLSRGFTIVELLVTIAIIGILAAVVLSSLNDARISGVDAKIKSEMTALSKRAAVEETLTFTYDSVCGSNGVPQALEITNIITAIETFSSSLVICNSNSYEYAASVPLQVDYWCVDNTGRAGIVSTPLSTSTVTYVCP